MSIQPTEPWVQAPLEPGFAAFLQQGAAAGTPPIESLPPSQARQVYRQLAAELGEAPPTIGKVHDFPIPGPTGALNLRLYTPPTLGPWPILLYVHGGGFVIGDLETHDAICRTLCQMSDRIIVAVDYRLAPECPFPAAPDDVEAALRWLQAHQIELGGAGGAVAIAGDSAGAQLSLVAARRLNGSGIQALGMFYPVAAHVADMTRSKREHGEGKFLTNASMRWFNHAYTGGRLHHAHHPEVVTLDAKGFECLPPTWIATLGHDPLQDDGLVLSDRLRQARVDVTHRHYPGAIHACLHFTKLSPTGWQLMSDFSTWLRHLP